MLSDSQIERYARQIVLPEIGGRGQERLLAASVRLAGDGEALLLCAGLLAAAGVGRLAVCGGAAALRSKDALASVIFPRNPDCRVGDALEIEPDFEVSIGEPPAHFAPNLPSSAWGIARAGEIVRVRFSAGRACADCLRAAIPALTGDADGPAARLLGILLALDALRALAGLAAAQSAEILRMDITRAKCSILPFTPRPGCRTCSGR